MKYLLLAVLFIMLFLTSCADDTENLKKMISELEGEKTILTDLKLKSQSAVDIIGKENISIIKGTLFIEGENIYDLTPLISLEEVGGLSVRYSPRIKNFKGFDSLKVIEKHFEVTFNDSLTSLSGLENIRQTQVLKVIIYQNKALIDFCPIKDFLDQNIDITSLAIHTNGINPDLYNIAPCPQ